MSLNPLLIEDSCNTFYGDSDLTAMEPTLNPLLIEDSCNIKVTH